MMIDDLEIGTLLGFEIYTLEVKNGFLPADSCSWFLQRRKRMWFPEELMTAGKNDTSKHFTKHLTQAQLSKALIVAQHSNVNFAIPHLLQDAFTFIFCGTTHNINSCLKAAFVKYTSTQDALPCKLGESHLWKFLQEQEAARYPKRNRLALLVQALGTSHQLFGCLYWGTKHVRN